METNYEKAIGELFAKHPSVQTSGFSAGAYKPGISEMERFDAACAHPWKSYRTIHVAGTNGKGTTCSVTAAALAAKGLRVGLFTSPHILDFRERIKIVEGDSCRMIPKEDVMCFLGRFEKEIEPLSFFEITTGMGLWWFREQKVDAAVIEVGLGGRLDSTNIITPQICIITSIGLDHCALLGGTRELIAAEKAGIFKPGVPALVWAHDPQTDHVFIDAAGKVGCPLHFADNHSTDNLDTCRKALSILGIPADEKAMRNAAAITSLHARWETETIGNQRFIFDIGHNPAALEGCFARLLEETAGKDLAIVYGIMADKDLDLIAPLMPVEAEWFLCAPATSRALPSETLSERLRALRPDLRICFAGSVEEAVGKARKSDARTIYIGGSTFVVAEALPIIDKSR